MKHYLPLGTAVKLKEESRTVIIIGYMPVSQEGVTDYVGTGYPAGMYGKRNLYCFNGDEIEEVLEKGYCDEKAEDYLEKLALLEQEAQKAGLLREE